MHTLAELGREAQSACARSGEPDQRAVLRSLGLPEEVDSVGGWGFSCGPDDRHPDAFCTFPTLNDEPLLFRPDGSIEQAGRVVPRWAVRLGLGARPVAAHHGGAGDTSHP